MRTRQLERPDQKPIQGAERTRKPRLRLVKSGRDEPATSAESAESTRGAAAVETARFEDHQAYVRTWVDPRDIYLA